MTLNLVLGSGNGGLVDSSLVLPIGLVSWSGVEGTEDPVDDVERLGRGTGGGILPFVIWF